MTCSRVSRTCQEPEPAEGARSARCPERPPDRERAIRKVGRKRRLVLGDAPSRGSAVRDDEESPDGRRGPPELSGDLRSEPGLPIECRQRALQIRDHRLGFDDEHNSGGRMPGKNVDRAAFAADRERHLGRADPPRGPKRDHDLLHQASVVGIQQPVEGFSVEIEADGNPGTERAGDPIEGSDGQAIGTAALDASDQRLRHSGSAAEIDLAPASPTAQGPNPAPKPDAVHGWIIAKPAHRPVTWRGNVPGGPRKSHLVAGPAR